MTRNEPDQRQFLQEVNRRLHHLWTWVCGLGMLAFAACSSRPVPSDYQEPRATKLAALENASEPVSMSLFLHGGPVTNNPGTLWLDGTSPSATPARYKDSAAVSFNSGNPWKSIGTWDSVAASTHGALTTVNELHVWLGLKNSDDIGTQFDLRAEVLRNGELVVAGEERCITGVTRNPALAKEVTLSFGSIAPVQFDGAVDIQSLRLSARIGTTAEGAKCSGPGGSHNNATGLRLYFDAQAQSSRLDEGVFPACADGDCDDGNPCTVDACSASGVCTHTMAAVGASCSDGNACNGDETCDGAGHCTSGATVGCKALDQCHDMGACDPATGECSNPAITTCASGDGCCPAGCDSLTDTDCASAPAVIATISVGGQGGFLALNPTTKRMYVGLDPAFSVAVVDTVSNTVVATIPTAGYQNVGLATNSVTGRAYITQGFANRVLVVDGATNTPVADVPMPSGDTIAGIAVNPNTNRVYVARNTPGGIITMDGATNTCGAVIDVGSGLRSITSFGMATDLATNRLYIADPTMDRVLVFDGITDQFLKATPVGANPLGLAVNSTTRRAYVCNYGGNTVSVLDMDTDTVLATLAVGSAPVGAAVDPYTNRVYVTNNSGNDVSILDGDTNTVINTIVVGSGPSGVAVDPNTHLVYVAHGGTISVLRDPVCTRRTCVQQGANCGLLADGCGGSLDCGACIAPQTCGGGGTPNQCGTSGQGATYDAQLIRTWGGYGTGEGQFGSVQGVTVDGAGQIYVVDMGNSRIQKFTAEGVYLAQWAVPALPIVAHMGPDGNLWVTSMSSDAIQRYTTDGAMLPDFAQVRDVRDLAFDQLGNVYATSHTPKIIYKLDSTGATVTTWSTATYPVGIAVDAAGFVYVAEMYADRIDKYTPAGVLVRQWGTTGTGAGEMMGPYEMVFDSWGNLLVSEIFNLRIQIFTPDGDPLYRWDVRQDVAGQSHGPAGIALDGTARVVVGDYAGTGDGNPGVPRVLVYSLYH